MASRTGTEKLAVLREIWEDRRPMNEVCTEADLQASLVLYWQRLLATRGVVVFTNLAEEGAKLRVQVADLEAEYASNEGEIARLTESLIRRKGRTWGTFRGRQVPMAERDEVVDVLIKWTQVTGISLYRMLSWLNLQESKYYEWRTRYGQPNRRWNVGRQRSITPVEQDTILAFARRHPLDGPKWLALRMQDHKLAYVSEKVVVRILTSANLIPRWSAAPEVTIQEANDPHDGWHVDVTVMNFRGIYGLLATVTDVCSHAILGWALRDALSRSDMRRLIQMTRARFPDAAPRAITDVGRHRVLADFRVLLSHLAVSWLGVLADQEEHVPRWRCLSARVDVLLRDAPSFDNARALTEELITYYNEVYLHRRLLVTPWDRLQGRHEAILEARRVGIVATLKARKEYWDEVYGDDAG